MSGNLLNNMGLGGIDIGVLILVLFGLILILFILLIVTMVKQSNLKKRYESFMRGRNARSMEEEIRNLFYDIDHLKMESESNEKKIGHIYKRLETMFQKVGLVKYDAFNQMGGKLSFALALLDEKDNGFLMNSVHSSDGSYCYVKEIKGGSCSIELSGDEQEALSQALSQKTAKPERAQSTAKKAERRAAEKREPEYEERPQRRSEQSKRSAQIRDDYEEDPDLVEAEALLADMDPEDIALDEYGEGVRVKRRRAKRPEEE